MSKSLLIIGVMFALAGCAGRPGVNSPQQLTPDLPYRTWEIGLLAPNYMEAWVESVDVLDRQGHAYVRVHGGLPSIQNPPEGRGNPAAKRPSSRIAPTFRRILDGRQPPVNSNVSMSLSI